MVTHKITLLIKFGEEEYMKNLFHSGTIYMNPIQYFRDLEDNELRGDIYEGVSRIRNYPPGQFEIPSLNFKGNYLKLQLRKSYETVLGNIYSLYCVSSHGWYNPEDVSIDKKNKRFGSHCVVIKDNASFIRLTKQALKKAKVSHRLGFVDYYDKDVIDREINLFEKPLEFEYQKEFRIYVDRVAATPFVLNIGSLANIAELHRSNEIIDSLRLSVK